MAVKQGEQQQEMTTRRCRWCGGKYVYPKGGRRPGCPLCQQELPGFERYGRH